MSSFNAPLICQDSEDEIFRKVYVGFAYERGRLGSGNVIAVPAGFVTDGASIPSLFWGWPFRMSPWGPYAKAAVLHDWLYAGQTFTRLECDNVFLEAMMALAFNATKAKIMFDMVRWFGDGAWKEHQRRGDPERIARGQLPLVPEANFGEVISHPMATS